MGFEAPLFISCSERKLHSILTGGACVGLGFGLNAISDNFQSKLPSDYLTFQNAPTQENWNTYKTNYNAYSYLQRGSDISFYAAGGFAILSGLTFFIKENTRTIWHCSLNVLMYPLTQGTTLSL